MENKPPIIGIVPLWDSEKDSLWMHPGYMDGIAQAGALPVMMPLCSGADLMGIAIERFDGFLLTGGQDVSPAMYGEPFREECGEICESRDAMETFLVRAAISADKPIFGICRGIQFLNVALGGALYQDIPTEFRSGLQHSQKPPYDTPAHSVETTGFLRRLLGADMVDVNSSHHQGIKTLSSELEPCAMAPDGLIEAVHMPDARFVLAVQWHPELANQWESSRTLFSAFVEACRKS